MAKAQRHRTRSDAKERQFILGIAIFLVIFFMLLNWISTHVWQSITILVIIIGGASFVLWKFPAVRERILGMYKQKFRTFGKIKDEDLAKLVLEIKDMNVQTVRDEEDFEKQLYQRLEAKGYSMERQVQKEGRRRIDLVVDRKIGVELKIADRAKNIQDLIGQITIYKKYYKKIVVGILDYGRVGDLNEYVEYIVQLDPENIVVVVLNGDVQRRQKKEEYIMVKKTTSFG